MIIHKELIQGSPDWITARLGKITASNLSKIMGKRGIGKTGETYAYEIIAEQILQEPTFVPVSWQMEWGIEHEPIACEIYERSRNVNIQHVGGIEDGDLFYSPDGLVGKDGLIEIKCPQPKQHLINLISDTVPDQYMDQLQMGLMVSGRKWIDFISFNPTFPDHLKAKVIRVRPVDFKPMQQRIDMFKNLIETFKSKLEWQENQN